MNRVRGQKFLTDLENTKNEKLMETIVTEIKNILEGIYSGLDDTEEQTSELEDRALEIY